MKSHRAARLAVVPLACMIALSACSGAPGGGTAEQGASPLSAYLGALAGSDLSPAEQAEEDTAVERTIETLVAECMTEQGFEYVPDVRTAAAAPADGMAWEPDEREWVAQYGYGLVDFPGRDAVAETGEEEAGPNAEYVRSLPESERAAYTEALSGPQLTAEEMSETEGGEYDWTTAGCYGAAQHEVESQDPLQSDAHRPVLDAIGDFYAGEHESPAFAELDGEWASCMSTAGFPGFVRQSDAQQSISDGMNELQEDAGENGLDPDAPELAELGEQEITLALADLECRGTTDYRAEERTITDRLEQEFIDDHRAELDALRAAIEQGR